MQISEKQKEMLEWLTNDERVLLLTGGVRASKSTGAALAFVVYSTSFENHKFILAGRTYSAVVRNVLPIIEFWCKELGISYQYKRSEQACVIGKNMIHIFGGSDETSQDYVQGMEAAMVFLDEFALMPESFVNQCFARMSVEGAKAFLTMNKPSPFHWSKKEIYDRIDELNGTLMESTIYDNPFISREVIKWYESAFNGVYYKRFIANEWAMAAGLVYPDFDTGSPEKQCTQYDLTVDWGTSTVTVAILLGKSEGRWYQLKEYYYDARDNEPRLPEEHADAIIEMTTGLTLDRLILDPSASTLKLALQRKGFRVKNGNNDKEPGIQSLQNTLGTRTLLIGEHCVYTLGELSSLTWDEKAQAKGLDTPLKGRDHSADALRYWSLDRYPPKHLMAPRPLPRGL